MIKLAEIRAGRRAASVATAVLSDLAIIQDRLIGYFHVDAGNPATDVELGAAALLYALAEQLEQAARGLRDCEVVPRRLDVWRRRGNGRSPGRA